MIKEIKCKVCGKYFEVEGQKYNGFFQQNCAPYNRSICSEECVSENQSLLSKKQAERKRNKIVKRKCRYCGDEIITNAYSTRNFCDGRGGECYKNYLSESRKGKNNPAYRNGTRTNGTNQTGKHMYACKKYRKNFMLKHDYPFCENCGVNQNGTMKFETHHIYFASRCPRHKELHNPKNLILLCIGCHNDFHASKRKEDFKRIEKKRSLKKLFNL